MLVVRARVFIQITPVVNLASSRGLWRRRDADSVFIPPLYSSSRFQRISIVFPGNEYVDSFWLITDHSVTCMTCFVFWHLELLFIRDVKNFDFLQYFMAGFVCWFSSRIDKQEASSIMWCQVRCCMRCAWLASHTSDSEILLRVSNIWGGMFPAIPKVRQSPNTKINLIGIL